MTCGQKRLSQNKAVPGSTLEFISLKRSHEVIEDQVKASLYSAARMNPLQISLAPTREAGRIVTTPERLESPELPELEINGQHKRRGSNHSCSENTLDQFYAAIKANLVVELYEKRWGVRASPLGFICGINGLGPCCDSKLMLSGLYSRVISKRSMSISLSLVPLGMPYAIEDSPCFGAIISTPFYSLIVANLPKFPSSLYAVRDLTLNRVLANHRFRHELALDHGIIIEPPHSVMRVDTLGVWNSLEIEVRELMESSGAYPPIPLLYQSLLGMAALMRSVFPEALKDKVNFYLNPRRFLEVDATVRSEALLGLTSFLVSTLDACVIPSRRSEVLNIQQSFVNCFKGENCAHNLINGLKQAFKLLSLTKVDQLNARLRDRIVFLHLTSGNLEIEHNDFLMQSGRIHALDFVRWLRPQPTIAHLVQDEIWSKCQTAMITTSTLENQARYLLSKLVAGFLWCHLRFKSRTDAHVIFRKDWQRILFLQNMFDEYILESLEERTQNMRGMSAAPITDLLRSNSIRESPVYQLIESRVLAEMAQTLERKLVQRLGVFQTERSVTVNLDVPLYTRSTNKLGSMLAGIDLLLSLHWIGAHKIYIESFNLIVK